MDQSELESYRLATHRRSGGKWVIIPFTFWGDFVASAKKHEFGSKYEKTSILEIVALRKNIIENGKAWVPDSLHMKVHLRIRTKEVGEKSGSTVSCSLLKSDQVTFSRLEVNKTAFEKTFALLHRIIKRGDSPFSSFKDAILFQHEEMGNEFFSSV